MDGERLLVVVDYQKDFVDGALGFAGAQIQILRTGKSGSAHCG